MKILLDQNLSPTLCEKLAPEYEVVHVRNIGMSSASDLEIWDYASKNGYAIVSKDEDFNSLSQVNGFPPHVIWVRLGNCSTDDVLAVLMSNHSDIVQIIEGAEAGIIEID